MLKSSAILSTLLLILFISTLSSAFEPSPPDYRGVKMTHKPAESAPPDYRGVKTTHTPAAPATYDYKALTKTHKLAARDAITLSIREVRDMRKFVNDIPRLKSVEQKGLATQLLPCVEDLIFDLSYIKSTLYRLRHLKPLYMTSDVQSLKEMMGHSYELMKMCNQSLTNMDVIVLSMLARKLDDLSMVIDDVIYRVGVIEQDDIRA